MQSGNRRFVDRFHLIVLSLSSYSFSLVKKNSLVSPAFPLLLHSLPFLIFSLLLFPPLRLFLQVPEGPSEGGQSPWASRRGGATACYMRPRAGQADARPPNRAPASPTRRGRDRSCPSPARQSCAHQCIWSTSIFLVSFLTLTFFYAYSFFLFLSCLPSRSCSMFIH